MSRSGFLTLCSAADLKPLSPPGTKLVSENEGRGQIHGEITRMQRQGERDKEVRYRKRKRGEEEERVGVWMRLGREREGYSGEQGGHE